MNKPFYTFLKIRMCIIITATLQLTNSIGWTSQEYQYDQDWTMPLKVLCFLDKKLLVFTTSPTIFQGISKPFDLIPTKTTRMKKMSKGGVNDSRGLGNVSSGCYFTAFLFSYKTAGNQRMEVKEEELLPAAGIIQSQLLCSQVNIGFHRPSKCSWNG